MCISQLVFIALEHFMMPVFKLKCRTSVSFRLAVCGVLNERMLVKHMVCE